MTIRTLFFVAILSISFKSFSQETTTGNAFPSAETNKGSVLIIPFEPRLYISDIDNQIAVKNEMNYQDIKAKFRAALDQNLFITLKPYFSPLSFYTLQEEEARMELSYIYNSIGYKYEVLPIEEEEETKGKKLLNKFKKKEKEEEYAEAGINNGQIVSQVDNREKYMKTVISNDELLPTLNKKYQAQYYIFINELDIKRGLESQYVNSSKVEDRTIKVHYTIFNNKEEVSSGAIITTFDGNENDINKIIKSQFGVIAQKIVNKIIPIEK
ncbi:MAG: hypothetical protein AB7O47_00080 [Flavobacteriales bacterium]